MSKANIFAALVLAAAMFVGSSVEAQLYINEIFGDPGGSGLDERDEYIELRGTPSMSLANHYLIFLENEVNAVGLGTAGSIENIFFFGDVPSTPAVEAPCSIGSNGFLTMRQKGNLYSVFGPLPSGSTNLVNNGSASGWGIGPGTGNNSTRHYGENDKLVTENSGFTAMLIRDDGGLAPYLGMDLDQGNDGLDSRPDSAQAPVDDWHLKWTILDSIGYQGEEDEGNGWLYGSVNFGQENPVSANHEGEYVQLPYEIEYVGRWGNSTGYTSADWHVSNLTEKPESGSLGLPDFRQSCLEVAGNCHPTNDNNPNTPAPQPGPTESNKDVPYGIQLTRSLGAPNFLLGDYNRDGVVDAVDYVVWRDTLGQTATETNHLLSDHSHNFLVDAADYDVWKSHFGAPNQVSGLGSAGLTSPSTAVVPEPSSATLLTCVLVVMLFGGLPDRWRAGPCIKAQRTSLD